MWPVVLFYLSSLAVAQDEPSFVDHCHETHALGLETLIRTAISLADEERTLIRGKYSKALDHASRVVSKRPKMKADGGRDDDVNPTWNPLCPMPNASMFTIRPPATQATYTTVSLLFYPCIVLFPFLWVILPFGRVTGAYLSVYSLAHVN